MAVAALLTPAARASVLPVQPGHASSHAAGSRPAAIHMTGSANALFSPAPPAVKTGDFTPDACRSFDARTNYGAATGTLCWNSTEITVTGNLVDTARYYSYSWAQVCITTAGCGSTNVFTVATALNGTSVPINADFGRIDGAGAWVRECSSRAGIYCSPWK